jgi:hypothetical protein
METSAKVGINVKNLFKSLAQQLPGVASSSGGNVIDEPNGKEAAKVAPGQFKLGGS